MSIKITKIKLNPYLPIGPQLSKARQFMGFKSSYVGKKIGWVGAKRNFIYSFENATGSVAQSLSHAILYANALGIKQITFILTSLKNSEMSTDYDKQALDFLSETKTIFDVKYKGEGLFFFSDLENRDIYEVTLGNSNHIFKFRFGQALAKKGIAPTAYDVLAVMAKSHPGSFSEFCKELDLPEDDRVSEDMYIYYGNEWVQITKLFSDKQIEKLREIF